VARLVLSRLRLVELGLGVGAKRSVHVPRTQNTGCVPYLLKFHFPCLSTFALACCLVLWLSNGEDLIRSTALVGHCREVHASIQIRVSDQLGHVASVVISNNEGGVSRIEDADLVTYLHVQWSSAHSAMPGHEVWALLQPIYPLHCEITGGPVPFPQVCLWAPS
jgi:hypothetical protein